MALEKPLVNKQYQLKKYPGKGGWTYTAIPEIVQNKHTPFGWVSVKGSIDHHEINNYKLMPMGNGQLFLPVKAEIRKKIGKKEGDWVQVVLFADNVPAEVVEEILLCLQDDDLAYKIYLTLTKSQQQEYLDWIYSAKTDVAKVDRIAETINRLAKGKKLREK
jgi:hypothetical protein